METRLIPEAGFELRLIDVGPLKSVSLMTRLRTHAGLPGSYRDCKRLMREFRPGAVLGVGGYASGPAMAAALWLKIPAMAYEPNAMPGLANRLVGKRVQAAAINFPAAAKMVPQCRGHRRSGAAGVFLARSRRRDGAPHLLVFGGSQGARLFNTHLPQHYSRRCWRRFRDSRFCTRAELRNFEATQAAYEASGADPARWQVRPFLDDMAARVCAART